MHIQFSFDSAVSLRRPGLLVQPNPSGSFLRRAGSDQARNTERPTAAFYNIVDGNHPVVRQSVSDIKNGIFSAYVLVPLWFIVGVEPWDWPRSRLAKAFYWSDQPALTAPRRGLR